MEFQPRRALRPASILLLPFAGRNRSVALFWKVFALRSSILATFLLTSTGLWRWRDGWAMKSSRCPSIRYLPA